MVGDKVMWRSCSPGCLSKLCRRAHHSNLLQRAKAIATIRFNYSLHSVDELRDGSSSTASAAVASKSNSQMFDASAPKSRTTIAHHNRSCLVASLVNVLRAPRSCKRICHMSRRRMCASMVVLGWRHRQYMDNRVAVCLDVRPGAPLTSVMPPHGHQQV